MDYGQAKSWETILHYLVHSSLNQDPIIWDYVQWRGVLKGHSLSSLQEFPFDGMSSVFNTSSIKD